MFRLRFSILLLITTPILASASNDDTSLNLSSSNAQVETYEASSIPRTILVAPNSAIKWDSFKIGDQTSFVSFLNEGGNITISNRLDLNSPINIQLTDASGNVYIINSNGVVMFSGLTSINLSPTFSLPNPINFVSVSSIPEPGENVMLTLGFIVLTFIQLYREKTK